MATTTKLYSYDYRMLKTYLVATIFISGNLLLPHLIHFIPNGGPILLPIYFFTVIASYKYGLQVGLLTAIFSPLINSLLFGMPIVAFLPFILFKSSLLAIAGSLAAKYFGKITILSLILVVITYQLVGTTFEWIYLQDFNAAIQDFRIGFPGMLVQIFGGYLLLKAISRV